MKTPRAEVTATVLDTHPSEEAYKLILPELEQVTDEEIERINVDVVFLVNNMLGALPEIMAMRPQIEATFKSFDFERFDRFRSYLLALNHAHAIYRATRALQRDVKELARVTEEQRERLLSVAQTLSKFGLVDAEVLKDIKKESGYRALASDTLTLVTLLKANWEQIAGSCPLTERDLNQAGTEVLDLQTAIGLREQGPALRSEAGVNRRKAYTLFRRCYEPIRRAAIVLYGEERASDVVPGLTQGNTRPTASVEVEEFDPEDETPKATAAAGTTSGASAPSANAGAKEFKVSNPNNLPITSVFEREA